MLLAHGLFSHHTKEKNQAIGACLFQFFKTQLKFNKLLFLVGVTLVEEFGLYLPIN